MTFQSSTSTILAGEAPPAVATHDTRRAATLADAVLDSARRHASHVALARHSPTDKTPITYGELASRIAALTAALRDVGIAPGDRVGLLADNDWRWIVSDLAIMAAGAVVVPRAADITVDETRFILDHAECGTVIVQNRRVFDKLNAVREHLPRLRTVIMLDDPDPEAASDAIAFNELMVRGRGAGRPQAPARCGRDSMATIVYTSGTTGEPKGVVLSHGNILSNLDILPDLIRIGPEDVFLSILPSWHSFERILEYFALSQGATTTYTDRRRFKDDLRTVAPTLLGSVPRIWENLLEVLDDRIQSGGKLSAGIASATLAMSRACRRGQRILEGSAVSEDARRAGLWTRLRARGAAVGLSPFHRMARRLVYEKVREATGGRLRLAISGGGSLPARVDEFFDAAGITLLNGYGLTETAPVVSVRTPEDNVLGTVGRPIQQTELEIRDVETRVPVGAQERGVIWVRGPQVMKGYYKNPKVTAMVMTPDGWFDTGDLGYRTAEGHLVITGRAKDTIVLSGGENIEPAPIEETLLTSPLIKNAVVVGQDRKSLGVLVVPRLDRLATALGIDSAGGEPDPSLAQRPEALDLVRRELRRLITPEAGFKRYEIPTVCRLLGSDFSVEEGTLTQTLKVRRNVVSAKYADVIEAMYATR